MRERIFDVIEPCTDDNKVSKIYDIVMIITIGFSLIPLLFVEEYPILVIIDRITVTIFIIDYLLRWMTADYKLKKTGIISFLVYPFTPMAIVDLLSILPSISPLNRGLKALRVLRLLRAMKVIRILRYSRSMRILLRVLDKQKSLLFAVVWFAIGYVFVTAIVMLQLEPQTFGNIFRAFYWAMISLTTVGYGDVFAVSTIGQIFTMVSAFVGIAIVALPAGIITAGYLTEMNEEKEESSKDDE